MELEAMAGLSDDPFIKLPAVAARHNRPAKPENAVTWPILCHAVGWKPCNAAFTIPIGAPKPRSHRPLSFQNACLTTWFQAGVGMTGGTRGDEGGMSVRMGPGLGRRGTPDAARRRPGARTGAASRAAWLAVGRDGAAARGARPGRVETCGRPAPGSGRLSDAGPQRPSPALFVQLQSARECGSAGCSTSVWLQRGRAWERVLDGVAGKLSVSEHRTRGMADLLTGNARYVWTGREYEDARPAPKIDLRPHRSR